MHNWKDSGKDGVQGYWIKNFSNLHERINIQTIKILMGDDNLRAWMTHGRLVHCQKDPRKGHTEGNYRPVTCLPLIWRLLKGMIAEEIYDYLERQKILPGEQTGFRQESRRKKDKFLIDKAVLKDCKKEVHQFIYVLDGLKESI